MAHCMARAKERFIERELCAASLVHSLALA